MIIQIMDKSIFYHSHDFTSKVSLDHLKVVDFLKIFMHADIYLYAFTFQILFL